MVQHDLPKNRELKDDEMDLVASMNMLDTLQEDEVDGASVTDNLLAQLNGDSLRRYHPRLGASSDSLILAPMNRVCISNPAFGTLMAITVLLFITSLVASTMLCYRVRYVIYFYNNFI
jgi:hypothetical protein